MIIQRTRPLQSVHDEYNNAPRDCAACSDNLAAITITFSTTAQLRLCNHCYRDLAYLIQHWDGTSRLSSVTRRPEKP
jgi:hypothetical protein